MSDQETLPKLPGNQVSEIEDVISEITADTDSATLVKIVQQVDIYNHAIRELKKRLNEKLYEWLEENDTELEIGNRRYYVGYETERWCRDNQKALELLLNKTGGDLGEVARVISGGKSAWKFSEVKRLLGEDFEQAFSEERKRDKKTGHPRKTVREVNEDFVK